jgi:molecular chaperone DnaK (HSP70)
MEIEKKPQLIFYSVSEYLVGEAAINQVTLNPENTVFAVKRLIGRRFSDPSVQADMKHWPFKVVCKDGDKPYIQVEFRGDIKLFSPEEISAMILAKMKEIAESFLGQPVKDAVITVPGKVILSSYICQTLSFRTTSVEFSACFSPSCVQTLTHSLTHSLTKPNMCT